MIRLAVTLTVTALAFTSACWRDESDPEKARKVIADTREDVAEIRVDIAEKMADVTGNQGGEVADRAEFIADTAADLEELDRRIADLHGRVTLGASQLRGEAKRDLRQEMTGLQNDLDDTRAALERFRRVSTRSVEPRQAAESRR